MQTGGAGGGATDIAIKDATAEAISVDKQMYIARILERSVSVINDWGNADKPGFVPLRMVPHLEHLGQGKPGHPHITRTLARLQGYELFRLPDVPACRGDWLAQIGALSTEAGEITSKICASLADDDDVCRKDIKRHALIDDAETLVNLAVTLLAHLRDVAGE